MIAFYTHTPRSRYSILHVLAQSLFQMDKCNVLWNEQHLAPLSFLPPPLTLSLTPDCCFSSYIIDIFPKHLRARALACTRSQQIQ